MESQTPEYDPLESKLEVLKKVRFKGFVMQPKSLPLVLWAHAGISANAVMLYQMIVNATYFHPDNYEYLKCPFTQAQLVELSGKSRNSIREWLKELEQTGLVQRSADDLFVATHYQAIFIDKRKKADKFANREDFDQAWSELFPNLSEKRQ